MELWDILDEHGDPTGKTVERGHLTAGDYHLVVHIWIQNDQKKLLIQQRADTVELMPGKWAITGGSALSGEKSEEAAIRELQEEMGIKAAAGEMKPLMRVKRQNSFQDIWLLKRNLNTSEIKMQPSEVQAVKWVDLETLKQLYKKGVFHRYYYLEHLLSVLETENE